MKLRFEQGMEFEDVAIYDLLRRARRLLLLRLLCQVGVHGLFGLSFLYSLCPCWRLPVGITDIFLTYPEGLLLINPWPSTTRSSSGPPEQPSWELPGSAHYGGGTDEREAEATNEDAS